jgi:hypothetical protein
MKVTIAGEIVSPDVANAIRHKKAQYIRFADTSQWDRLDTVILPDAKLNFYDENQEILRTEDADKTPFSFNGLDEFKAFWSRHLDPLQVIHVTGPGEMETTDREDEVNAIFNVSFHQSSKGAQGGLHIAGGGYYHETWKRVGHNDWRIKEIHFKRVFWRIVHNEDAGSA